MLRTPKFETMADQVFLRDATADDIEHITRTYNYYVRESLVSLQEAASTADELHAKLDGIRSRGLPYLVAIDRAQGQLCGFAYADKWHERSGYHYSVETTIYLAPEWCRKRIGPLLLRALLDRVRACGKKRALAKISILPEQAPDDVPSCRLHMALGFRTVGRFPRIGFKLGQWVDVIFLQLDLD